ncbi:MAG: hypothetical protein A3J49_07995 [Gallionellales bacterium RIFCSPHIGHO2_02_FULL_57_16]|nr:MAG: hypothetical protein A3J49_07995 [Gallionellales bacterium RIFCSPHIGHO2_02_FULL_57_16]
MFEMNFRSKFSKMVFFVLCCFLIGGVFAYRSAYSAKAEPAKTQSAQPVTNCFESRVGYTSVERVENAVPEYGYPNVKCSQRTGKVVWWGDPYDGTIPMGEMPAINDATKGDFAQAVVKPREPHLAYFNMDPVRHCAVCHDGKTVPFSKNKKPRTLAMHQDIVEDSLQLKHGRGAIWCLDCHSATNRNKLIDHQGNEISFNQPQKLCGGCHGAVYIDWRAGIHGKRIGSWVTGGKKRWWVCTECHNPHTVQTASYDPIVPEPAPALPRGMKNADHERSEHVAHKK